MRWRSLLLILGIHAPGSLLYAQDQNKFGDLFSAYSATNGPGYLKPLGQALGGSLNTGFVLPARIRPGFHLRVAIETMSSFFSDGQKTFQGTTDAGFTPVQTVTAPTIIGPGEEIVVNGDGGLAYVFPAGLEVTRLTLGVPQVTIGSVMGTEATLRWIGYSADKVGRFSLLGLGLRHSLSQYLENPPLDLAVGALYHSVKLTDIADLSALLISAHASLERSVFVLYGGLGYETSTLKMDYENAQSPNGRARYDVDGAKGIRATAGVALDLRVFRIHTDFNLGSQKILGLGLSFGN